MFKAWYTYLIITIPSLSCRVGSGESDFKRITCKRDHGIELLSH